MDVVLALNERLTRTPDGCVWGQSSFGYASVERYLSVFDRVKIVARVLDVESVAPGRFRVDGPGMELVKVPWFVGPAQYLRKLSRIRQALKFAVSEGDAVILRVPAWHVTRLLAARLRRADYPFAVEVCGDAYDRLAPGAYRQIMRPLLRAWLTKQTKRVCHDAVAALYVTDEALQRRYPPAPNACSVGCSDVALPDEAFAECPRTFADSNRERNLVFVGSLSQPYKAPDVLIEAVARCVSVGLPIRVQLIGSGPLKQSLQQLACRLRIDHLVSLPGQLEAGDQIRKELDTGDVFVLPSRQEGLPRAMVEAMARGLPCIGSTVGGIPELLSVEDMVAPGDCSALAAKICEVLKSPARMSDMAARNFLRAQDFHARTLDARRTQFYEAVKEHTDSCFRPAQSEKSVRTASGADTFVTARRDAA